MRCLGQAGLRLPIRTLPRGDPHLRSIEGGAGRLVVRYAFQHLGERALYEGEAPVPNPDSPASPAVAYQFCAPLPVTWPSVVASFMNAVAPATAAAM